MNLIFRLLYVYVYALFRERLSIADSKSRLPMMVLPNDLDIIMHMNNGRYLTICDLNRVDLFIRSGLLKTMRKRKWFPVIAEHTMSYKKPLNIFQRYEVKLAVQRWDEKYFYMTHTFICKDRVVAEGTSKGCVYQRGVGVVPPERAFAAVEEDNKK